MTFENWLAAGHYRESTVVQTTRAIRSLQQTGDALPPAPTPSQLAALRRYTSYLATTGARTAFDRAVLREGLTPARTLRAKGPRKRPAVRFPEPDWARLTQALSRDKTPEGHVLCVMAATGLRVGDVLRITRTELATGCKTGILQHERKGGRVFAVAVAGASDVWQRLLDGLRADKDRPASVAAWICPTGQHGASADGGAYKRVTRHLQVVASQLGLDGRIHTHRLRRTVGQRALGETNDIHAVQQLLGHRSLASTQRYVDELRVDVVAALQQRLRK